MDDRCPVCGYTKVDAQFHMDHRLCRNDGNAPWQKQKLAGGASPCGSPLHSMLAATREGCPYCREELRKIEAQRIYEERDNAAKRRAPALDVNTARLHQTAWLRESIKMVQFSEISVETRKAWTLLCERLGFIDISDYQFWMPTEVAAILYMWLLEIPDSSMDFPRGKSASIQLLGSLVSKAVQLEMSDIKARLEL